MTKFPQVENCEERYWWKDYSRYYKKTLTLGIEKVQKHRDFCLFRRPNLECLQHNAKEHDRHCSKFGKLPLETLIKKRSR